jgi:hypothetical protein
MRATLAPRSVTTHRGLQMPRETESVVRRNAFRCPEKCHQKTREGELEPQRNGAAQIQMAGEAHPYVLGLLYAQQVRRSSARATTYDADGKKYAYLYTIRKKRSIPLH